MSREQLFVGIAILVLVIVIFVLMALSWRRRGARQASIGELAGPPAGHAEPFAILEGLHLATTLAGRPLERVIVEPLEFRARGVVAIGFDGVELSLAGSAPAFIPARSIQEHARASWTIDRGVEENGLNVLTWRLTAPDGSDTELDSAFRMREPEAFDAAIARLLTERTPA
jgi:hypothetical protein